MSKRHAISVLAGLALALGAIAPRPMLGAPAERPDPSHPRVVLLGPSADDATVARVHDELSALGFEVRFEVAAGPPQDLAGIAQRHTAAAVAYVERWPPEVVIWVDPARSGAAPGSEGLLHVSDSITEAVRAEQLAVRAAELLRGKLLPVSRPSAGAGAQAAVDGSGGDGPGALGEQISAGGAATGLPGNAGAPGATPRAKDPLGTVGARSTVGPAPRALGRDEGSPDAGTEGSGRDDGWRHGTISVGPALLLSPGGVPAMPQIRVAGGYNLGWRIGFEGSLAIPTTEATVSADAGDVGLRALSLSGTLTIELTPEDMDFGVLGGLGMGATALFFDGSPGPAFAGVRGTRWAAAPQIELAARYRFHPLVAARIDVVASLLRPEPIVRIAGQEVASFGQPSVLLALGLEVLP